MRAICEIVFRGHSSNACFFRFYVCGLQSPGYQPASCRLVLRWCVSVPRSAVTRLRACYTRLKCDGVSRVWVLAEVWAQDCEALLSPRVPAFPQCCFRDDVSWR